jgi:hypothetical protein
MLWRPRIAKGTRGEWLVVLRFKNEVDAWELFDLTLYDFVGQIRLNPGVEGDPDAELDFTLVPYDEVEDRALLIVLTKASSGALDPGLYQVAVTMTLKTDPESTKQILGGVITILPEVVQ